MRNKNPLIYAIVSGSFLLLVFATPCFGQTNPALDSIKETITEQHKMLARSNGVWTGEALVWFSLDEPPVASTSILKNHMDSNGRFQISEIEGNVTGAGKPFTGVRITGYDPVRKVFTRAMLQDGSPGVVMEGLWDNVTQSITMPFKQFDRSGKESSLKEVYTIIDEDTEVLEIYSTSSQGNEIRVLKVTWRRKK